MSWIVENYGVIFGFVALAIVCGIMVYQFVKMPRKEQIDAVKSWLILAVTEAEKYFGSGTGALKLRYVYDLFVTKFPYIAPLVSFELFSSWVDEALVWLNEQLKANKNVKNYVEEK